MSHNEWLYNLKSYSCPTCKKSTIFKSGCVECDKLESDKQDFKDLTAEYKDNAKQIKALQARQLEVANELVQIDTRLNGG